MKSWARSVLRISVVAGMVAATAVTPAPAFAAPLMGLQYLVGESEHTSSVYKSVKLFCPDGQRVIGGAYELLGAVGSVVLDDFIPSTDNFTVGAGEVVGPGEPSDGTPQSWHIKATVVCAFPPSGLEVVTNASGFGPGNIRRATAECPDNKVVLSAGAPLSYGWGQISVNQLTIFDRVVMADAVDDEDGYSGSWSVTAYAVCADPGLNGRQLIRNTSTADSNADKPAAVQCPDFARVLGVGWALSSTEELINSSAGIFDVNFKDHSEVRATGSEDASGRNGSWTVGATAICANA